MDVSPWKRTKGTATKKRGGWKEKRPARFRWRLFMNQDDSLLPKASFLSLFSFFSPLLRTMLVTRYYSLTEQQHYYIHWNCRTVAPWLEMETLVRVISSSSSWLQLHPHQFPVRGDGHLSNLQNARLNFSLFFSSSSGGGTFGSFP